MCVCERESAGGVRIEHARDIHGLHVEVREQFSGTFSLPLAEARLVGLQTFFTSARNSFLMLLGFICLVLLRQGLII